MSHTRLLQNKCHVAGGVAVAPVRWRRIGVRSPRSQGRDGPTSVGLLRPKNLIEESLPQRRGQNDWQFRGGPQQRQPIVERLSGLFTFEVVG